MTLSAPSLLSNVISAVTGFAAVMMHLMIGPPIGTIALSISAAVVPGAKFSAMTVYGPASPRMDMPFPARLGWMMLNWLSLTRDKAVAVDLAAWEDAFSLPRLPRCIASREEESLLMLWRSWVQSALTLPGGTILRLGSCLTVPGLKLVGLRTVDEERC